MRKAIPLALGMFLVFVFWGEFITGHSLLFDMDIHTEFLPLQKFVKFAGESGGEGWWNPYSGFGSPLLADGHAGIYYIPSIVYRWLGAKPEGLGVYWGLHLIYCFFFTYKFASIQGLDKKSSILSAVVFSFSGYLTAIVSTFMYALSITHTPALFYFLYRGLKKFEATSILFLGLIFSQQYMIGYVPFTFNTIIALLIFALVIIDYRQLMKSVNVIFYSSLVAIMFSLPQLIPTLEFILLSNMKGGASYEYFVSNSLSPKLILSYLYPLIWGSNDPLNNSYRDNHTDTQMEYFDFDELHNYIGLAPLFLVLFSILNKESIKEKKPFIILGVMSFLLSLGANIPFLYKILHSVPLFSYFKDPAKWSVHLNLCLSVIAAWGLSTYKFTLRTIFLILVPVAVTSLWIFYDPNGQVGSSLLKISNIPGCREGTIYGQLCSTFFNWSPYQQFLLLSFITFLLFVVPIRNSLKNSLLIFLVFIELYVVESSIVPRANKSFYHTHQSILNLKNESGRVVDGVIPSELDTLGLNHLSGDIGAFYQIPTLTLTSPFVTVGWEEVQKWSEQKGMIDLQRFNSKESLDSLTPFLEGMGVSSILEKNGELLKVSNPRPLAYVSYNSEFVSESEALKSFLKSCEDKKCSESLVSTNNLPSRTNQPLTVGELNRITPEHVSIKVSSLAPGVLVYLDQYYPGWTARLNGVETPILKINGLFKGVKIPNSGLHEVDFEFRPISYTWGRSWFWICWFLVLPLLCIIRKYHASNSYGRWERSAN